MRASGCAVDLCCTDLKPHTHTRTFWAVVHITVLLFFVHVLSFALILPHAAPDTNPEATPTTLTATRPHAPWPPNCLHCKKNNNLQVVGLAHSFTTIIDHKNANNYWKLHVALNYNTNVYFVLLALLLLICCCYCHCRYCCYNYVSLH